MLLLCLDLETSGVIKDSSVVLEIGYILKRVGEKRPWLMKSEFIYEPSWPDDVIPNEASLINGILLDHVKRFGRPLSEVMFELSKIIVEHKVDAVVGHNIRGFDLPFILHHADKLPPESWGPLKALPVIDTMTDVPYPKHIKTRALNHLCAEHSFLNMGAHSALYDCDATLRLLEHYDAQAVLARGKEPSAIYKAQTRHPRDDNGASKDRAKACGFSWNSLEGREYPLSWIRRIRESEIEEITAKLGFPIVKISG